MQLKARGTLQDASSKKPNHGPSRRGRPSKKRPQALGVDKPHKCPWEGCGKSFGRASDLKRHHNTHTNTRPYGCKWPNCGKWFIQTSALTVHGRTHTGEKPHACETCQKCFADSSSLARHRKTHDEGRTFTCGAKKCKKSFGRKGSRDRHMELKHPEATRSPTTVSVDKTTPSQLDSAHTFGPENGIALNRLVESLDQLAMPDPVGPAEGSSFAGEQTTDMTDLPPTRDETDLPNNQLPLRGISDWSLGRSVGGIAESLPDYHYLASSGASTPSYYHHGEMQSTGIRFETPNNLMLQLLASNQNVPRQEVSQVIQPQVKAEQLVPVLEETRHRRAYEQHRQDEGMNRMSSFYREHEYTQPARHHAEPGFATPDYAMSFYSEQGYHDPIKMEMPADSVPQYQLPGSDFSAWLINDDDKFPDTFGELTPGQLLSYDF